MIPHLWVGKTPPSKEQGASRLGGETPAHPGPPGFAHSKVKGYDLPGTAAPLPALLGTLTLSTRLLAGAELQTVGALSGLAER